jgi:hypothetical protein
MRKRKKEKYMKILSNLIEYQLLNTILMSLVFHPDGLSNVKARDDVSRKD